MRVHLVEPNIVWAPAWFGKILYHELRDKCDISMSNTPDQDADVNHWLLWIALERGTTKLDTAQFTHFSPRSLVWKSFGVTSDAAEIDNPEHLVAMTEHGKNILVEWGIPSEIVSVIYPGNDEFQPRNRPPNEKIVIGMSGRPYPNGRKREWLPLELSWLMDLSRFEFMFLGGIGHWVVGGLSENQEVSARIFPEPYTKVERYPEIFPEMDAYLCTGFIEGGPMGAIQALGCGIPVISPDYGFAHDFKDKHPGIFIYNSIEELIEILKDWIPHHVKPLRLKWQDFAQGYFKLWQRLTGEVEGGRHSS